MGVRIRIHPTTLVHGGFGAGESRLAVDAWRNRYSKLRPLCGLVSVSVGFVVVLGVMVPVCVLRPSQAFWGRLTGCVSNGFAERVGVV